MTKTLAIFLAGLGLLVPLAGAQPVEIERSILGSGEPGQQGFENAVPVADDMYHAPQYLPGSPTAASVWPRVVRVNCRRSGTGLQCDGYQWTPAMGRAEYLFFVPVIVSRPAQ